MSPCTERARRVHGCLLFGRKRGEERGKLRRSVLLVRVLVCLFFGEKGGVAREALLLVLRNRKLAVEKLAA